jgi:hypothetical protein
MRLTRGMLLEVLRQDYVRTAWAKGLRERVVVLTHAEDRADEREGHRGRVRVPGQRLAQLLLRQRRALEVDARTRALEHEGIVVRRSYAESPPRVEYELTEKGEALLPIIDEMRRFGHAWLMERERAAF